MHAPALKLALALPTLLLPSAVRRDTAYPPLAERVVTRHRILASTKPRQKAQLFGAHIAPVIAPTSNLRHCQSTKTAPRSTATRPDTSIHPGSTEHSHRRRPPARLHPKCPLCHVRHATQASPAPHQTSPDETHHTPSAVAHSGSEHTYARLADLYTTTEHSQAAHADLDDEGFTLNEDAYLLHAIMWTLLPPSTENSEHKL